jgi:DhnA family fructose-bisphosphate aldolase class Ia
MDKHDGLKKFLHKLEHPALLLDTSGGISLGPLPGLEEFKKSIPRILPSVDGLICSPGLLHRLTDIGGSGATLLVRMDWTNTLRGSNFPLPPLTPKHLTILEPKDALALGANGMVIDLLLGYEEAIEAHCLRVAVQLALAGRELGLPLIVEVRPYGPRIAMFGKAVELGAALAQECGADGIVVPYPGMDSLKTIATMAVVPWLLKPSAVTTTTAEWEESCDFGSAGLWLDQTWLATDTGLDELAEHLHTSQKTIEMNHEH